MQWRQFFSNLFRTPSPTICFYSSSVVDEQWIRTTAKSCSQRNICVTVVIGETLSSETLTKLKNRYKNYTIQLITGSHCQQLSKYTIPITVTASSGLCKADLPFNTHSLIHMPHSLASLHMIYPKGTFEGYDQLFACGPHHVQEVAAMQRQEQMAHCSVTDVGYGKLDLFSLQRSCSNRDVLIAPSWGEHNLLKVVGFSLIEQLIARQYRVVLRPHPLMVLEDDPSLRAILKSFSASSRFSFENPMETGEAMLTADYLISDFSGTAFEYALHRLRKVIFVDLPKKEINPHWRDLGVEPIELRAREQIGQLIAPDATAVCSAIDQMDQNLCLSENPVSSRDLIFNYGRCGERAADLLEQQLKITS